MYCPRCGKENPDDANYCIYCGKNLKDLEIKEGEGVKKGKIEVHTFGSILSIVGIAVLILAVVRICFGLMPYTVIDREDFFIGPIEEYVDGFAVPKDKDVEISLSTSKSIDVYVYTAEDYYSGKHTPILVLNDVIWCSDGFTNSYDLGEYVIVLKNDGWDRIFIDYLQVSFKDASTKLLLYSLGIVTGFIIIVGGIWLSLYKRETTEGKHNL